MSDPLLCTHGLTPQVIDLTWAWFANNARDCANDVQSGAVRVNDPEDYVTRQLAHAAAFDARAVPISLAFIQRAYWLQTGEMPSILTAPAE